jgi:heavy metal sensor kinase
VTLPLRARLAVGYALLAAMLLVGLAVISYRTFARELDAAATTRAIELAKGLHGYLRFDGHTAALAFDANDADQAAFVGEAARYYQVYDAASGVLLVRSAATDALGLRLTPAQVRTFRSDPRPFDIGTTRGRYRIANSILADAPGGAKLLQVAVSLAGFDATLDKYVTHLWLGLPLALAGAGLAAWWMAGVALAPLSGFAAAARSIDVNGLSERLPVRGTGDEIDAVAHAFNDTLARLDHAIAEMRQFSAALAHELRTPLAALRGEIELSLLRAASDGARCALASQLEELDKLNRLIDQILTLARAESGQFRLRFAPVNLAELGSTIVEQLEPIAQSRAISLEDDRSELAVVEGDAGWLQRLLLNLLDNALKFTTAGGRVTLRVSRHPDGARLDVRDTGIGIAADTVRRVFEPFFRADEARSSTGSGAGLGLSLVKWIVDAHRGHVAVDSRPGKGSTFTVWLPTSPNLHARRHDPELIDGSRTSHSRPVKYE